MSRVDFTKRMKSEYTIIAPDIFPTHMELLREIFIMNGYKLEVVRYEGKHIIDTGLKYLHNDICYPAICMLGQQLYALTCGDYDPRKTALIMFQTGGGCRASNYIWVLRKALKSMGLGYVPVISVSFSGIEKYSGFKLTLPMILKGITAVVYGDMLLLLKNQIRPYEKNSGDTKAVVDFWISELSSQFRRGRGLSKKAMLKNLRGMAKSFSEIPVIRAPKTKVGIVGEIYVKYSSFGNNGLEKFLQSQGCEYMIPGVLAFFQYCFASMETDFKYYGGSRLTKKIGDIIARLGESLENRVLDALGGFPDLVKPAPFKKLKEYAEIVIDRGVKMGEGWLLPAEIAELVEKGYPNIVCAQPFGCLPNHIVGKGVIRTLREKYPDANIFPIDYDSGASKVNQENRIKLMLAIAREKNG
ncbi:MAG: 2-hydroxyglutaryl-CoA dehydratase [Eubacteriales bacterium]